MNTTLVLALIGNLVVTSYRSLPEQTDSTPYITSTNEHVGSDGVAVSRDLLCGACRKLHRRCRHPEYPRKLHYGDWLYIKEHGFKRVNDCMGAHTRIRAGKRYKNKPITNQIDIWVRTYKEEKVINISNKFVYKVVTKNGGTYDKR